MAKKMIDECLEMLDTTSFEGSVDSVIGFIANMRAESHAKGYSDLRFKIDWGSDGIDAYELWGSREETQEEAEAREERERKAESSQLREERQQQIAASLVNMTNAQIIQCLNIVIDVEPEEEEDGGDDT